jgi:hypothetical protein
MNQSPLVHYRIAHSLTRYPIHLTFPRYCNSLEEYLTDLVGHLPIEERRKVAADASLDFTEAALVLQNSSNIYSRKVEYLYTLVYKALNDLAGSVDAATGAGNKKGKTAGDIEIDDFHAFDPHQEFLLLDDVLPVDETDNCEKINLPESADDAGGNRMGMNHRNGMIGMSAAKQNQNQTARLSLGVTLGGDFSTTMDRSVQAMNAAAHRALIGSLDTGSLRLIDGQCDIDESGVLLMPGTASQRSTMNFASQETMPQSDFAAQDDGDFGGGNHDDYDEGDDDGGGGFAFGDDQGDPPAPEDFSETHHRVTFAETVHQQPKKKRSDPWELLDPHTPDSVKARPLRIGKTIKLPPGVDELPSECVTGARTKHVSRKKKGPLPPALEKPTKSLATETFKATMAARKRSHNETTVDDESAQGNDEEAVASFPSVPLKGLVFGHEFAYIAKASAKRKAAERRELRKQQLRTNAPIVSEEDDDNDDDDGGFAFGGMDDGDDGDDGDFGGACDNDNAPVVGNTGMASLDEAYHYHAQDNPGTWIESLSCWVIYISTTSRWLFVSFPNAHSI